jgi:hypothetical protein
MSGAKRRSGYRKTVTSSADDASQEPGEGRELARILRAAGSNLFEVELAPSADAVPSSTPSIGLALLPTRFRKLLWIKRGDPLLVVSGAGDFETSDGGANRVRYLIEAVVSTDSVRALKKSGRWPATWELPAAAAPAAAGGGEGEGEEGEAGSDGDGRHALSAPRHRRQQGARDLAPPSEDEQEEEGEAGEALGGGRSAATLALQVNALKLEGDGAFARRDFGGAIQRYARAIELLPSGAPTPDRARSVLFCNRAACHFQLADFPSAALDAASAVSADPTWSKAKLRLGASLVRMGKPWEGITWLTRACEAEPEDMSAAKLLKETLVAATASDATGVTNAVHFVAIFGHIRDVRLRLATLAHMWNATAGALRFEIFSAFLSLVAGPSAIEPLGSAGDERVVHISAFDPAAFETPLPMVVYADVAVPRPWLAWYEATVASGSTKGLLELWRSVWGATSAIERALIEADFRTFYAPEQLKGEAALSPRAGTADDLSQG